MIFPLKKRKLIRGCQAHIDAGLGCGADYVADRNTLYLPENGRLERSYGLQGGNWLKLYTETGYRIEFAHLHKYLDYGIIGKEGDAVAITGNTGQLTTGPHLHVQIFDINNKRINPEEYFKMFNLDVRKVMSRDGKTIFLAVGLPTMAALKGLVAFLKAFGIRVRDTILSKDL